MKKLYKVNVTRKMNKKCEKNIIIIEEKDNETMKKWGGKLRKEWWKK